MKKTFSAGYYHWRVHDASRVELYRGSSPANYEMQVLQLERNQVPTFMEAFNHAMTYMGDLNIVQDLQKRDDIPLYIKHLCEDKLVEAIHDAMQNLDDAAHKWGIAADVLFKLVEIYKS